MSSDKTILIAEPIEALSSELKPFLASLGIGVVHLKSLKETLIALQNRSIDILLLDSSLLEGDCTFISIIKGISENVRIILCADTNTPEFESSARQQRIFYYHIKAFGTQELEMAVSNAVNYSPHHSGGFSHVPSTED
jgi:DNA-binding NtrC family response regulator